MPVTLPAWPALCSVTYVVCHITTAGVSSDVQVHVRQMKMAAQCPAWPGQHHSNALLGDSQARWVLLQ
jgi:hypothetical protein